MTKLTFTGGAVQSSPPAAAPRLSRNAIIAVSVIVFHVLALWALQTGLLRRAVAVFVPVEILSEIIEPPAPVIPPPPPEPPKVTKQPVVRAKTPTPPPPPQLQAVPNPDPAPNAPTAVVAPPAPLPPIAAPVAVAEVPAAAPPAPPAPPRIELPSSDAEYLNNPNPVYPPMSKRLMEQGTVLIEVVVGADGSVKNAEIKKSSGFERLDKAALATALKWRFVPGKRAGVPTEMPYVQPFRFRLEAS